MLASKAAKFMPYFPYAIPENGAILPMECHCRRTSRRIKMLVNRDRRGNPIHRAAKMLTKSRLPTTTRVIVAREDGATPGEDPNHAQLVVLIESRGLPTRYALFDNLYDGLAKAQINSHTDVLLRLLVDLGAAGVAVHMVANTVARTRKMGSAEATEYLLRQPIELPPSSPMIRGSQGWPGAGLAIAACAMAACSLPHPQQQQTQGIAAKPKAVLAIYPRQQRSGTWELVPCADSGCARPTPKTLAGSGAATPVAMVTSEKVGGGVAGGPLPALPAGKETPARALPVRSVFFRTGSSVPDQAQAAAIRMLTPALTRAKKIVVTGCTDKTGTPATNQRLAELRAAAIRDELVRLGIPKEKIESQIDLSGDGSLPGIGVTDPIPGDINARSRRGDIAIV